ncbi:MAG: RNA polymerase sigma factor, partial [Patescibacteria group bacterium]
MATAFLVSARSPKEKRVLVESLLTNPDLLTHLRRFAEKLVMNSMLWTIMEPKDIVQWTCLRVIRYARLYDPGKPFQTWTTAILKNIFLNAVRNLERENERITGAKSDKHEFFISNQPGNDETHALAERNEFSGILMLAVNDLPPALREAFVARELKQMTYGEIAQMTGVPENTVKTRIFRARARLAADRRIQALR